MSLSIVVCAVLAACDPVPGDEQIGVRLLDGSKGEVSIVHWACDSRVEHVRLKSIVEPDAPDRDELVWEIETAPSADLSTGFNEFTAGETPRGFKEVRQLEDPLSNGEFVASVRTTDGLAPTIVFEVDELREGRVLTNEDSLVTVEQFTETARGSCTDG